MSKRLYLLSYWNLVLLAFLFLPACNENAPASKEPVTAEYTFSLPSKGRPGSVDEERKIHLYPRADRHLLKLGTFSTAMSFAIFNGEKNTGEDHPLIEKQFAEGDTVVLDISTLKKGNYDMNFSATEEGCRFHFTIE